MTNPSNDHSLLLKTAPYYSVAVAIIISAMKLYSYITTDSVSLLASLVDSLLDLSTSTINLLALRVAMSPPDHNHRFGHNKIEDLAVFGQSIAFCLSGLFAFYNAVSHAFTPKPIENIGVAMYAMIISSILTLALISYQSMVIKKTKSGIIEADRLHYVSDLLTNMLVMFSLYFSQRFMLLDALLGIIIACYIIYNSYDLFIRATRNLIDEEFNDSERSKIVGIIAKYSEVVGIHELKTRYAGTKPFIQFHIEMDGDITLYAAHEVSEKIMEEIMSVFPGAEVTVHQDPAGVEFDAPYREKL